jgi:hypothetical protein
MKHNDKGGNAVAGGPRTENTTLQARGTTHGRETKPLNQPEVKRRSEAPLVDQAEMERRMEMAGRPGAGHKALEAFVGEWDAEVKCWMDPGSEPEVTRGKARVAWILNGRFLREEFEGEMMGKPFKGIHLVGYDNMKQTFNSTWINDASTSMFTTEGEADSSYKTITLNGLASCPVTGREDIPTRVVITAQDRDQHRLEMFDDSEGKHIRTMEITYTRK